MRIARRRRLAWLLWQVAVLLLALAVPGCAASADGPYAGIRTLASRQAIASSARNSGRIGPVYQVDDTAAAPGFLAGYRRGAWALEAGAGELGHRSSHNVSDTFDIRQDIATRHAYAAGLYHVGRGPWSAHILAGVTRVSMQNFERGSNENGPDQVQRNSAIDVAPIVGLGIAYTRGRATLRLDALRVENVARSLWTNHSDVTAIAASLVYTFGGP